MINNNYLNLKHNNWHNENKFIPLTVEEKYKLRDIFNSKIIFENNFLLVKYNDKGYKIFHSESDKKYYLCIISFKEPIDLEKPIYFNVWKGNAIMKDWAFDIEGIIKIIQTNPLFINTMLTKNCLYMNSYDINNRNILVSRTKKYFGYNEYLNFYKWYIKNFIWILLVEDFDVKRMESKIKVRYGKRIKNIYVKIEENPKIIKNEQKNFLICFSD